MMDPYQYSISIEEDHLRIAFPRLIIKWLLDHWIVPFTIFIGLYVGLAFLAPIFMKMGWSGLAGVIYWFYSFQCHQLPQRSFFLFGSRLMYSLGEINSVWGESIDPLVLREFIGDSAMGWKVAWSDRMVYMYTSTLVFGLIYWPLRRKVTPLTWWGLILLLLPMFLDGSTHLISDLAGFGHGFRYTNSWLAALTNNAYSATFYAGNGLGSFNSWMRLITGVLFGLGIVWYGFPYVDAYIRSNRRMVKDTQQDGNPRW